MMQYRKFGKLDWQASPLGFGCMRLPTLDGKSSNIDQAKVTEMVGRAIDAGVNYFDTAYVYHDQMSEVALGKALAGGYRERVCLATKSPIWLIRESADFDRLLDEQLRRLQTQTIDFYLLHALNRDSWAKIQKLDLLRRAEAAKADGRIRYIGFSFHDNLETFKQIVDGYTDWDFCQIQYNYMDIAVQAGTEGLHYAASKGLAVVIMEPLLGGKLALDLPATRPLWASASQQRKPADWALQWLWNQPEVSVVLSGMSTLEQVEENIHSASLSGTGTLNPADIELIAKVRNIVNSLGPIPCTHCEYCLPCPNGVDIPRNFDVYNQVAMYDALEDRRFEYKRWIPDDQKAAACIQCDECFSKCPQQIPISTWLPVVEDVLGLDHAYVKSV
ncbi:MAG TPA: aldo/keto reductase [Anaerolineales bacterium]|nr:aldo/keto reductase [Anaerolineales bacterium]